MKYLFFDIESAQEKDHKGNICDFGYVLCDESLNIIESEDILINPECDNWDWYVGKNILPYRKNVYEQMSTFPKFYDKIYKLLTDNDTFIINHEINSDVELLRDTFNRYGLKQADYVFYDLGAFYRKYRNINSTLSLDKMAKNECMIEKRDKHNGLDDALRVRDIIKALCLEAEKKPYELFKMYDKLYGEIYDGKIELSWVDYKARAQKEVMNSNNLRRHMDIFDRYLDSIEIFDNPNSPLNGKKVSISRNYEDVHYYEMMYITYLLSLQGATYVKKASVSDIFVKCNMLDSEGNEKFCSKLKYVKEEIDNGVNIEIISFDELLKLIDYKETEMYEKAEEIIEKVKLMPKES